MRKTILAILLAGLSSWAAADWVEFAHSEHATFYVDPATIHKTDDKAKIWHLIDFKKPFLEDGVKPVLSTRINAEFDCKEQLGRQYFLSTHAGKMGEGEMIRLDSDPGAWGVLPLGSLNAHLWKIACGKQ